jgi:hypothetical protein
MLEFQVFRISVFFNQQIGMFNTEISRSEVLKNIILSKPDLIKNSEKIWHIGNVLEIGNSTIYFRIGKTSKLTVELFHEGNFVESEFETSPYTHVVLNTKLEICAIAKKIKLSPTISGISHRLIELFKNSSFIKNQNIELDIKAIKDPTDFISHLKSAYSVKKFWVTLSPPNAFDVDSDFTKPLSKITKELKAESAKAELRGTNLDQNKLESISRSAASLGNNLSALILPKIDCSPKRIHFEGNNVIIFIDNNKFEQDKNKFSKELKDQYKKIKKKK